MNPKAALAQLKAVTSLVSRSTSQLVASAAGFSAQSTEVVLSVFGGALAAAIAYVVSVLDGRFSFPILGTLATLAGLTSGILAVRFLGLRETGRDSARHAIEMNREIDRYLRAAYLGLPRGAAAERQALLALIIENDRRLAAISSLMWKITQPTSRTHLRRDSFRGFPSAGRTYRTCRGAGA